MLLLIIFILFSLEAIYEALFDRRHKTFSSVIELFYRIVVLLSVFAWIYGFKVPLTISTPQDSFVLFLIGVALFRYMFFDQVYNLVRGNRLFYIGLVKYYDQIFRWFLKKTRFPETGFQIATKIVFGLIGISLMGFDIVARIISAVILISIIFFAIYTFFKGIYITIKKKLDE